MAYWKLYSMFQDLSRPGAQLKPVFGEFVKRLKSIKFGLAVSRALFENIFFIGYAIRPKTQECEKCNYYHHYMIPNFGSQPCPDLLKVNPLTLVVWIPAKNALLQTKILGKLVQRFLNYDQTSKLTSRDYYCTY